MAKHWYWSSYRCECRLDDCFLKIPDKEYEIGRLIRSTKGNIYIRHPNCSSSLVADETIVFESDTFNLVLVPWYGKKRRMQIKPKLI